MLVRKNIICFQEKMLLFCKIFFTFNIHFLRWHGCPRCIQNKRAFSADHRLLMGEAYQYTIDKKSHIESKGYTYVEKWECDLNRELAATPAMKQFFNDTFIMPPLDGRDGKFYFNEY
jgi:hypothetical protein